MLDLKSENVKRAALQIAQDHSNEQLKALNERVRKTYPLAYALFDSITRVFLNKLDIRDSEKEECLSAATAAFVVLMLAYED